jgi:tetratricopeptide (TPR) repeat protein
MRARIGVRIVGLAVALALACGTAAGTAVAFGEAPKPKIDCRKKKNEAHPDCQKPEKTERSNSNAEAHEIDAAYSAAYVLAQRGEYASAREILRTVEASGDPRILNYLGFTTRKLGAPKAALAYYRRALDVRPDYAMARSYMGEAYIALGRVSEAKSELVRIERLCGVRCDAYRALENALHAKRRG